MINGARRVLVDPTLLSGYPIIGYPLIYEAGKSQKITDPHGAGRVNRMVNGTGTRPASMRQMGFRVISTKYRTSYQNVKMRKLPRKPLNYSNYLKLASHLF